MFALLGEGRGNPVPGFAKVELVPTLSSAFAEAVVNAADNDWLALAGDHAPVPGRHRRARTLARQALALAVPLGAAAGIAFTVRPPPAALVPLLTFLVGLAVARVLRWLDLSGDLDPALTISELPRKPGQPKLVVLVVAAGRPLARGRPNSRDTISVTCTRSYQDGKATLTARYDGVLSPAEGDGTPIMQHSALPRGYHVSLRGIRHATSAAGQAKNTTTAISSTFLITAIMVGSNLCGYRLHLGVRLQRELPA
jgi:hypothetical protein